MMEEQFNLESYTERVTLDEMNRKAIELFELVEEKKALAEKVKEVNGKMTALEAALLSYLEKYNLTSFDSPKGKLFIAHMATAKLEDKKKFREYVGEEAWEALTSINSRTLTSWFKVNQAQAEAEGDLDFKVPGIKSGELVQLKKRRK